MPSNSSLNPKMFPVFRGTVTLSAGDNTDSAYDTHDFSLPGAQVGDVVVASFGANFPGGKIAFGTGPYNFYTVVGAILSANVLTIAVSNLLNPGGTTAGYAYPVNYLVLR